MVPHLPSGFHVSAGTLDAASTQSFFTYGAVTLYRCSSQSIQLKIKVTYCSPNPGNIATSGLASSAFARHY